jgi:hypothetical protein
MDNLAQWNTRLSAYWERIDQGVLVGVLLGAALPLLFYLVLGLFLHRRRCRGLKVVGDGGVLFVSLPAVKEFVRRVVHEFPDSSFHSLELDHCNGGYQFNVSVDVLPTADMVGLRQEIGARLREEARARLGLADRVVEVNLVIHRLLANEKKWRRQKGDAMVGQESDREEKPTTTGEE